MIACNRRFFDAMEETRFPFYCAWTFLSRNDQKTFKKGLFRQAAKTSEKRKIMCFFLYSTTIFQV